MKTSWSCVDDFALFVAVQLYGSNWKDVSEWMAVPRGSKQCRERWHNYIDPCIDSERIWTGDDILTLLLHYSICGSRWSEISKQMPGFSANALKNKYNKLQRSLSGDCVDPITTLLRYEYMIRSQ